MHTTSGRRTTLSPLRLWPLLALLAVTLFPFGWLGELWPPLGHVLNFVFATAREHAVGHMLLFLGLGLLLLAQFPGLRARPWRYAGLMLLAAIAQECFQLLYKQRPFAYDDARDLVVDMAAALLAFVIVLAWRWLQLHWHGRSTSRR